MKESDSFYQRGELLVGMKFCLCERECPLHAWLWWWVSGRETGRGRERKMRRKKGSLCSGAEETVVGAQVKCSYVSVCGEVWETECSNELHSVQITDMYMYIHVCINNYNNCMYMYIHVYSLIWIRVSTCVYIWGGQVMWYITTVQSE